MQLFGLTEKQCYGTDEDKNTHTDIMWGNLPNVTTHHTSLPNPMTAREFLQYFGTDICRCIKPDVWVENCINRMLGSGTELAIVPDVRFPNEADAIKQAGGKVIRLTRSPHEDSHESETALNDYKDFDYVLENSNMTMDEANRGLLEVLKGWSWLQTKGS